MLYWKKKGHSIYLGDCLKELKKLPSESVDLIITDPHYNINLPGYVKKYFSDNQKREDYLEDIRDRLRECVRVLKKEGGMYLINYPEVNARILPLLEEAGLILRRWLDRKSTRLNSSHIPLSRMPSSA